MSLALDMYGLSFYYLSCYEILWIDIYGFITAILEGKVALLTWLFIFETCISLLKLLLRSEKELECHKNSDW